MSTKRKALYMNERITIDPGICHGQPCIKGTRIMVYLILELVEEGLTPDEIIRDYYPSLTKEDIQSAIHYAVTLIKNEEYIFYEEVI